MQLNLLPNKGRDFISTISYLNIVITEIALYADYLSSVINLILDFWHIPASAMTFYVKCSKGHFNLTCADVEPLRKSVFVQICPHKPNI